MKAAPLLVSFHSLEKYLEALPSSEANKYSEEIQELFVKKYPPVTSAYSLAILFGYSLSFMYALTSKQTKFYRRLEINQKGKLRSIYSPRVALKVIQKWIGYHLEKSLDFPSHVYGFIKGRSFVEAAEQHIGSTWVASVDIESFFPSIKHGHVVDSLGKIGYSNKGAQLISDLCSLDGFLPQGSPASPVLSNLCMLNIDSRLESVAKKYNAKLTRYADDIVFSGSDPFYDEIFGDLNSIFEASSFTLNSEKNYLAQSSKGQRLVVHGLLIKEDKITLTKGYRNKIRAYKHMRESGKIREEDIDRIDGHLTFADFISSKKK